VRRGAPRCDEAPQSDGAPRAGRGTHRRYYEYEYDYDCDLGCFTAARAASSLATGTRKGEQET
jgi:hypothetical protein